MSLECEPKILGRGWTSIVSLYDTSTVLKGYQVWHNGQCHRSLEPDDFSKKSLDREHTVYQRLGVHPNILRYYGRVDLAPGVYSLRFELAERGSLRDLVVSTKAPPIGIRLWLAWQTSLALAYIHSKSVVHGDISCRNILICQDWIVKISDFGGSTIDDGESLGIGEEIRYELPLRGRTWEARPSIQKELFALGSALYEIEAWKMPFDGLQDGEVERNYAEEKFPGVEALVLGDIICRCWDEQVDSATDVLKFIVCKMLHK
jgi:serine/threonine protein kinase